MELNLETKVQYLAGVGPKMAQKLERLGIETSGDLIFYYPRDYKDFTKISQIADIKHRNNETVTIRGKIVGIANKTTSQRHFAITEAVVEDGTASIKAIWFNQPFLKKMLPAGREVILNGKVEYNFFAKEVVMASPERALHLSIVPVYGETAGLSSRYLGKLISNLKPQISGIKEWLPTQIIEKYSLLSLEDALLNIHKPFNSTTLEKARRRIAFDELFLIALRANLSKIEVKKERAPEIEVSEQEVVDFVKELPYELTSDQKKSAWAIIKDLQKNSPMNRLLNGDVGSGKTVVAAIAAFVAVKAGFRVAIMAPTSILAFQHFETLCKLLKDTDISIGLFTRERKECSQDKKSKIQILNSDIVIGTQALIQEGVDLENLGLVVVDEQHRFGVKQRGALLGLRAAEEKRPHFLSMTATPIPRTLHLALFGDLDISVIKEKPLNRKEIKTRFVEPHNREKAYQFIKNQINAGRQVFIICPLIESKENGTGNREDVPSLFEDERKTVKKEYEKLQKIFPEFKIGMLHGKMKSVEKDEVMSRFSNTKMDILVSTSVVEVGVDVPNASVMMIEDAEHFGLAQIHQFRGRVGRAEHQSFCFLFSPTLSPRAIERLHSLEVTSDGFKLAEIDLETRGPGAMFGTEQSGLLDLKMADFSDRILIEEASSAAKEITLGDPELANHPLMKEKIAEFLINKHME